MLAAVDQVISVNKFSMKVKIIVCNSLQWMKLASWM